MATGCTYPDIPGVCRVHKQFGLVTRFFRGNPQVVSKKVKKTSERRKQAGSLFINVMGRTGVVLGRRRVEQNVGSLASQRELRMANYECQITNVK